MPAQAAALDRRAFLTQCRLVAEKHLSERLEPLLAALPRQLERSAREAPNREARDQYLQAQSALQYGRTRFLASFRSAFEASFEGYARPLLGTGRAAAELDSADYAAMRTNLLECEVAVGRLAARLKEQASDELARLSAGMARLFRVPAVDPGENPLGPLPIARGIFAGFTALKIEGAPLRALRSELENRLAEPVRELFDAHHASLAPRRPAAAARPEPRAMGPSATDQAAAARALESTLAGTSLPATFELFLRSSWAGVLARAHAAQGTAGAPWLDAVNTMQALVWSLQPKASAADRARLTQMLPALLKKVSAGMQAAALDARARKVIVDALVAHHRGAMR